MLAKTFLYILGALPIVSYACTQGAVRLVNGGSAAAGRLEICYNNAWGTVCDDDFDNNDARVVCRQLGYSGDATYRCCAYYGQGTGNIILDDLRCSGNEASLLSCARTTSHNCHHGEDVGVLCLGGPKGEKGAIGPVGIKGQRGDTGPQGPEGPQGPTGPKGVKGDTGLKGLKGDTGLKGTRGDTGPQGPSGLKGLKGDTGLKGLKGDTGLKGTRGDTGPQGPEGPQGPTGLKGVRGDTGLKGVKGDTGLKGETGGTGPKGETGERGQPGLPANMTDLKIQQQQAIKVSTNPAVQLSYSSIAFSIITIILMIICLLTCKLSSYIKKLKNEKNAAVPIADPYSLHGLQKTDDIHVLNKQHGDLQPVFKPEDNDNYEELNFNTSTKKS